MDRVEVKKAQAFPRKGLEAKYAIEEQRQKRKKLDLFERFRRVMHSVIKRDSKR